MILGYPPCKSHVALSSDMAKVRVGWTCEARLSPDAGLRRALDHADERVRDEAVVLGLLEERESPCAVGLGGDLDPGTHDDAREAELAPFHLQTAGRLALVGEDLEVLAPRQGEE